MAWKHGRHPSTCLCRWKPRRSVWCRYRMSRGMKKCNNQRAAARPRLGEERKRSLHHILLLCYHSILQLLRLLPRLFEGQKANRTLYFAFLSFPPRKLVPVPVSSRIQPSSLHSFQAAPLPAPFPPLVFPFHQYGLITVVHPLHAHAMPWPGTRAKRSTGRTGRLLLVSHVSTCT